MFCPEVSSDPKPVEFTPTHDSVKHRSPGSQPPLLEQSYCLMILEGGMSLGTRLWKTNLPLFALCCAITLMEKKKTKTKQKEKCRWFQLFWGDHNLKCSSDAPSLNHNKQSAVQDSTLGFRDDILWRFSVFQVCCLKHSIDNTCCKAHDSTGFY